MDCYDHDLGTRFITCNLYFLSEADRFYPLAAQSIYYLGGPVNLLRYGLSY